MPVRRCIVAATDFSETSREALAAARAYAGAIGARVRLMHVIPDPARLPWTIDPGLSASELEDDWRANAVEALARARDDAGLAPRGTELIVATGDAAREITAAAAACRADLIVLGTHGHGFFGRLVMGSVADAVIRRSDRPVLIVPHPVFRHDRMERRAARAAREEVPA